jgi:hypothetical protein
MFMWRAGLGFSTVALFLKIVSRRCSSCICVSLVKVLAPFGCRLFTMVAMSWRAAVSHSLLFGKGNGTFVGNQMSVFAVCVEFVSML